MGASVRHAACRLVGKLAFSAVIDAAGWTGHVVKMDLSRLLSMLLAGSSKKV